jgi:hypothetical protein|tara:strand:- start:599 stop:1219 length:621 start_codon:yes stop_codon:yes gene_type:complete
MKYFSIDIETSGLDPNINSILEFAAIYEDTTVQYSYEEIPKFERIINYPAIVGSFGALHINRRLIKILASMQNYWGPDKQDYMVKNNIIGLARLVDHFYDFAYSCLSSYTDKKVTNQDGSLTINVAGKNFGTFDKLFIENIAGWQNKVRIAQRVVDPAILFYEAADERLPDLSQCKHRAGIKSDVTHKAVDDAWDVIELLRIKLGK